MTKTGEKLGKWTIRRALDQGGQGRVFAATDGEGNAEVAVKVVRVTKQKKRSRFLQEIAVHTALSKQGSPNVMPVIDHNLPELKGEGGVEGYLVMPLAQSTLDDHRSLLVGRVEFCLEIFAGIVQGVAQAHAAGIVHRDIKPRNVLFLDSTLKVPYVSDFGVCLLRDTEREDRVTEVGETVGAKYFMAPEQQRGEVVDITPSADNYALGKLLCYMLTGRYMFREEVDQAFSPAELKSDRRLQVIRDELLLKTIQTEPTKRLTSAKELLEVVERLRGGGGEGGGGNAGVPPTTPPVASAGHADVAVTNKKVQAYRAYATVFGEGRTNTLRLEVDQLAQRFNSVWNVLHESFKARPQEGEKAIHELIEHQPEAIAYAYAIARAGDVDAFRGSKRLIEHIVRSSENQSGYQTIFTVPHALAGLLYMGMSTIAFATSNWVVLKALLTEKFEFYYQSGRPLFSYGFAMSYFFHVEALQRKASQAHDLYRGQLMQDPIVKSVGLNEDAAMNAYLQTHFLMSLRAAQLTEDGEEIRLWPDFARYHGYRVEPLLDRIYHDKSYGKEILGIFGESREIFFERIDRRLALLQKRMEGSPFFWESIDSWEPRH